MANIFRCFPLQALKEDCDCKELVLSSTGGARTHATSLGLYYYFDNRNGHPVYQHENGLRYINFEVINNIPVWRVSRSRKKVYEE